MNKHKNHISDEQLDELFKSMSEEISVDFEPASWQTLDAKLQAASEQQSTPTSFWKNNYLLIIVLLLFTGISSLWLTKPTNEIIDNKDNHVLAANNRRRAEKSIFSKEKITQTIVNQEHRSVKKLIRDFFSTKKNQQKRISIALKNRHYPASEPHHPDVVIGHDNMLENNSQSPTALLANSNLVAFDSLTLLTVNSNVQTLGFLVAKPLNNLCNIQLPLLDFVPIMASSKTVSADKQSPFSRKGLIVGLYFSPDISTIANNQVEKVGTNYAVQIEYRFSKRWTLQTGVIRSYKVYEAYGSQYEIPLKWNVGATPKSVDAVCDMLDLPLNIRYDMTQKQDQRFFVSTGLTSYVMLKEAYYYTYDVKPRGAHDSWIGTSGPFLLSNLNFSVGYEARITNRLTWQAEPFARVPISSIGWSKVNLFTLGTFVSLKYRFK